MSLAEADSKFPGQHASGIPPSPTRENPGQFYPQSDPKAAPTGSVPGTGISGANGADPMLGNPYVLGEALSRLDHALSDVISKVQREERSAGSAPQEDALVRKLTGWRDELTQIRGSGKEGGNIVDGRPVRSSPTKERVIEGSRDEGGLFAD